MARTWQAFALLALSSCLGQNIGSNGTDADGADGGVADASNPRGEGCGVDPNSGATLCAALSFCPGLVIDPAAYPSCGFFGATAGAIDVRCSCGGELCPLGATATCAAAQGLLAQSNEGIVCAHVSEGICSATSGGSTTSSSSGGSCDKTCKSQCAGDPGCVVLCGC